jgi:hypothetical protein
MQLFCFWFFFFFDARFKSTAMMCPGSLKLQVINLMLQMPRKLGGDDVYFHLLTARSRAHLRYL